MKKYLILPDIRIPADMRSQPRDLRSAWLQEQEGPLLTQIAEKIRTDIAPHHALKFITDESAHHRENEVGAKPGFLYIETTPEAAALIEKIDGVGSCFGNLPDLFQSPPPNPSR